MFSQFDQRLAALEEQHKDVVSRLQESHFQVSCLRGEILELREENTKLRNTDIVTLQNEVSKLYTEMSELKAENAILKEPSQKLGGNTIVGHSDGGILFMRSDVSTEEFMNQCHGRRTQIFINSFVDLPNIKQINFGDGRLSSTMFIDTRSGHIIDSGCYAPVKNSRNEGAFKEFERIGVKLLLNGVSISETENSSADIIKPPFPFLHMKKKTYY